jgi:hypothetical protein
LAIKGGLTMYELVEKKILQEEENQLSTSTNSSVNKNVTSNFLRDQIEMGIKLQTDTYSLQSTVIFDLLFSNTDRHGYNFLLSPIENSDKFQFHAIDNGGCLNTKIKDILLIDIVDWPQMRENFLPKILTLISDDRIEKYRNILLEQRIHGIPYKWMILCAKLLKIGIEMQLMSEKKLLPQDIAVILILYREMFMENSENPKATIKSMFLDVMNYRSFLQNSNESEEHKRNEASSNFIKINISTDIPEWQDFLINKINM